MLEFLTRLFKPRQAGTKPPYSKNSSASPQNLRESEEHFSELVSGIRDYAVLLLDADGNILTWNAGAEQIKGYRAEEIIGQNIRRFYTKEAVASGWPAHELKVAAETGRFEDEGWRLRKDGTKFWASVVITALRDPTGHFRGYLKITRNLTDRKQAEEKLRLSEERFRLLVEGVMDYAIYMLDTRGRVVTWNAGAERLKFYTSDEIIGEHFSRFYPADAIERGWPDEELKRATMDGRIEDEGWRVRKDGSLFWANVVITALRDERGTLIGFGKVTRDLTARREAEQHARRAAEEEARRQAAEASAREIEKQREQLQVTLTSIGDAVIVTDTQGLVTFLNPIASGLTGWSTQDAQGLPLDQVFPIIHEETRQTVENPVTRAFRERSVVLLANHTSLISRDGREIPVEDSAAPIWDRDGQVCGAVLVFRDVTESRRATEARLQLAAIVESSDDAIIGNSLEGIITSWNRGATQLYGYWPDEMIGQPVTRLIPEDHPNEFPELINRIKRGESIQHYETIRRKKDGNLVPVSLSISPMMNADGKVIGASKIARDMTLRREEDRRKSEFLALLAHELRNPLAPLRNTLQILRMGRAHPQIIEEAQEMMERQLEHLVRLVDDLMDVSRITQGKLQVRKQLITLDEIVTNALEICGQSKAQHHQRFDVSLPEQDVYLEADRTRMAQTLSNLLSNAVKYSDPGSPILLRAYQPNDDELIISVKDEGVGLSSHMLTQVFGMFTQVEASLDKSQGGLGIGLSIVKSLVEMHGGTVEARSEGLGKGSEFIIKLPVVKVTDNASPPLEAKLSEEPAAIRRILVVDDNIDAAKSMEIMLQIMGNEVRTANDGLDALEVAESLRPDVILLDIGMPRLNGFDACRRLREEHWGRSATIIALTGWGHDEDRRRSRDAGFDGHLIKPVEFSALEGILTASTTANADIAIR